MINDLLLHSVYNNMTHYPEIVNLRKGKRKLQKVTNKINLLVIKVTYTRSLNTNIATNR